MRFKFRMLLPLLLCVASISFATEQQPSGSNGVGVVDFRRVLENSKIGKQEQNSLEAMRKQLAETVQESEQELTDLARKIQDPDYLDSLSPEAEEQLKIRYQTLAQQLGQQQQQFYQMLSQAEYRVLQELNIHVMRAAKKIAGESKLDYIVREEAFFFFEPSADITEVVVAEMDRMYETELQNQGAPSNAS